MTGFYGSNDPTNSVKGKKVKEKQSTCIGALHGIQTTLKRSGMDHTDLPAINTIPVKALKEDRS